MVSASLTNRSTVVNIKKHGVKKKILDLLMCKPKYKKSSSIIDWRQNVTEEPFIHFKKMI